MLVLEDAFTGILEAKPTEFSCTLAAIRKEKNTLIKNDSNIFKTIKNQT